MDNQNAVAKVSAAPHANLMAIMAEKYAIKQEELFGVLKKTCFKGSNGEQVTDEQMVALLVVSNQYNLNPFLKEIYAFPAKGGGIVPVVGVDGWFRIINERPEFDGIEFDQTDKACKCTIYRKDRTRPVVITEYLDECKRNTEPWNTAPKRMLRHKAAIQCARIAFSFSGIKDEDEAERIAEFEVVSSEQPKKGIFTRTTDVATQVTDQTATQPSTPAQQPAPQPTIPVTEMRKILSDRLSPEAMYIDKFFVSKKYLQPGEAFPAMEDQFVEKVYKNYDDLMKIYGAWKTAQINREKAALAGGAVQS
jgi:phage recombination protein Bet